MSKPITRWLKHHVALRRAVEQGNVWGRYPLCVQIQTTSSCNGECRFCPHVESWHRRNPGVMSDRVYRRILAECAGYRLAKFLPYFANEPLADPSLFDRIELALSRLEFGVLELSTNASLLDSSKLDAIARIFPPVRHEIWVSFHGVDRATFESVSALSFDRCLDNVLALLQRAQDLDLNVRIRAAGSPRIRPEGSRTDLPVWFDQDAFESFWSNQFRRLKLHTLPSLEYFTYHDRAGSIHRHSLSFTPWMQRNLERFYCLRCDQWMHFLYTGELVLCCMDYHRETVFGDIRESPLSEIDGSQRHLDVVRRSAGLVSSQDDFICKRCISPGG